MWNNNGKLSITIVQSWAGDNSVATMWPCFQGTKLFVIAIFTISVVAIPSRHQGLTIFLVPDLVLEALLRCRVVVVAKLKNCRVPSSAIWIRIHNTTYSLDNWKKLKKFFKNLFFFGIKLSCHFFINSADVIKKWFKMSKHLKWACYDFLCQRLTLNSRQRCGYLIGWMDLFEKNNLVFVLLSTVYGVIVLFLLRH